MRGKSLSHSIDSCKQSIELLNNASFKLPLIRLLGRMLDCPLNPPRVGDFEAECLTVLGTKIDAGKQSIDREFSGFPRFHYRTAAEAVNSISG